MAANLELTRDGVGIELRRGTFHVLVDDRDVATVEWRQTVNVPVEPGHHRLRIAAGRFTSPERSFDVADGGEVAFRCHGALIWPLYVASMLKPDLAISLRGG